MIPEELYEEYKESLFEKLMEPLNDYLLAKIKIDQLRHRKADTPKTYQALDSQMMAAKDRVAELLIQEKDLDWCRPQNFADDLG